jgi:hypothetical protein
MITPEFDISTKIKSNDDALLQSSPMNDEVQSMLKNPEYKNTILKLIESIPADCFTPDLIQQLKDTHQLLHQNE